MDKRHQTTAAAQRLVIRRKAGHFLRYLRLRAGYSQSEFNQFINSSYYAFVSAVEGGKNRIPPKQFRLWATAYRVPPRDLFLMTMRYYDPEGFGILFENDPAVLDGSAFPLLVEAETAPVASKADTEARSRTEIAQSAPSAQSSGEGEELRRKAGRLLKLLRLRVGLTQNEVMLQLDGSKSKLLSQIEIGFRGIPHNQFRVLAAIYRIDARDLYMMTMRFYDPEGFEILFENDLPILSGAAFPLLAEAKAAHA